MKYGALNTAKLKVGDDVLLQFTHYKIIDIDDYDMIHLDLPEPTYFSLRKTTREMSQGCLWEFSERNQRIAKIITKLYERICVFAARHLNRSDMYWLFVEAFNAACSDDKYVMLAIRCLRNFTHRIYKLLDTVYCGVEIFSSRTGCFPN